jgi:hypothetical protein
LSSDTQKQRFGSAAMVTMIATLQETPWKRRLMRSLE